MTDRAKKISELTSATGASSNSLVVIVANVAGTLTTKKMTVNDFFGNTSANVFVQPINTPANSAALTIKQGAIFFDNTYLYVATSNNTVKRVSLSSF